ncbi:BppU family phage baseplate upper protein [Bacillus toyonensis]|uniref:BppU family phage baseplate upper protein n=1 Tax=Bacillus toyonensis TaxID=155322 RepID=UPI000BFB9996|nr:BppU family phage baseplate upper protein [Bacillus toyonensis]PHA89453.1 hypothetical protein COE74_09485 [Bacillus toyonensis]
MGMNQIIELTVDIQDGITHSYKEFSQNNLNNSELILNIADGGKEFSLEEKDKIIVYFQKPDKQFVFQDKDIVVLDKTKGKIKVLLTAQTIVVPGTVYGEISIERVEGGVKKRTSTYSFTFRVRPSLASNEVIESTNEYGVIQKAIEVGEKFKDVEFDPIIAAGELAKGALPKTGGTMTGNFNFQTKDGAKMLQWYNDQTQLGRLVFHPSGLVEWFGRNGATETSAWNYSPTTNTFNIVSNTNVLKKAEAFYDYAQPNGDTININGQDLNTIQKTGLYGGNNLGNSPDGTTAFFYVEVVRYSDRNYIKQVATVLAGTRSFSWTRKMTGANAWNTWDRNALSDDVVKKAGDTVTGAMTFLNTTMLKHNVEHTLADGKKGVISVINDSNSKWALAPIMNGTADWTKEVAIDLNTGKLTVASFATKKDGRVNLTLTADGSNPDTNYPLTATRRGNTVTVSGSVMLNSATTGATISNLPVDMRPVGNVNMYTPVKSTTSGDVMQVFINATSGALALYGARGKAVDFVMTYTVN